MLPSCPHRRRSRNGVGTARVDCRPPRPERGRRAGAPSTFAVGRDPGRDRRRPRLGSANNGTPRRVARERGGHNVHAPHDECSPSGPPCWTRWGSAPVLPAGIKDADGALTYITDLAGPRRKRPGSRSRQRGSMRPDPPASMGLPVPTAASMDQRCRAGQQAFRGTHTAPTDGRSAERAPQGAVHGRVPRPGGTHPAAGAPAGL
jgi:hypothetical protein